MPVQKDRRTLGAKPVFMNVRRDGSDAFAPEIKGSDPKAGLFHKRQKKPAQAGIHMKQNIFFCCCLSNSFNGINHPVGIGWRGRHDEDGAAADLFFELVHIHGKIILDRDADHFELKIPGCLFPRHMDGFRRDHFRLSAALFHGAGVFPGAQHGQKTGFSSSGSHGPHSVFAAMQQRGGHPYHLAFKALKSLKRHGI